MRTVTLPKGSSPQDVKLSPDGRIFYVADLFAGGIWKIDARTDRRIGFVRTGAGAHGLYPSRDARYLYVSNRSAGTVSVLSFRTGRVVRTWRLPGGGSPDMGGVSASGAGVGRQEVGLGPHGVCVYPQPGRYSLGHTGIMR